MEMCMEMMKIVCKRQKGIKGIVNHIYVNFLFLPYKKMFTYQGKHCRKDRKTEKIMTIIFLFLVCTLHNFANLRWK